MKILEQTSNKLVCQSERSAYTLVVSLLFSLGVSGMSLMAMHFFFASSGVESLTCKRVEPTQVNCQLTRSTYMGLKKRQHILLPKVIGARANKRTDREERTYYNFILLTQKGEVSLTNNNPYDASYINEFIKDTESILLTVKHDNRLQSVCIILFSLLFVVIGFVVICLLLYLVFTIETFTFNKSLGKLTREQRILFLNKAQTKECSLRVIVGVQLEETTDGEGDKHYGVNLLFREKRYIILIPCLLVSNGKREWEIAKSISKFLNVSYSYFCHDKWNFFLYLRRHFRQLR